MTAKELAQNVEIPDLSNTFKRQQQSATATFCHSQVLQTIFEKDILAEFGPFPAIQQLPQGGCYIAHTLT